MDFEWDDAKNQANRLKHGIGFEQAVAIFEGWTYSIIDARFDYGEMRKISIGAMPDAFVVTVVHTDRAGRVRVISARPASAKERTIYETSLRSAFDDGRAR